MRGGRVEKPPILLSNSVLPSPLKRWKQNQTKAYVGDDRDEEI